MRDLCHDLIEPAATIRWLVQSVGAAGGEDLSDRLGVIAVAAGQIAAICDGVLDPRQLEAHQRRTRVRLDKVAGEAVECARVRHAGEIEVMAQPVTVLARPGDVIRIVCNILGNACRAGGPAGRISVVVGEARRRARLSITDSGAGLGHAATRGRAGLGLEIIGELALKYGGSVHLAAGDLGGLAVTVELPAHGGDIH